MLWFVVLLVKVDDVYLFDMIDLGIEVVFEVVCKIVECVFGLDL